MSSSSVLPGIIGGIIGGSIALPITLKIQRNKQKKLDQNMLSKIQKETETDPQAEIIPINYASHKRVYSWMKFKNWDSEGAFIIKEKSVQFINYTKEGKKITTFTPGIDKLEWIGHISASGWAAWFKVMSASGEEYYFTPGVDKAAAEKIYQRLASILGGQTAAVSYEYIQKQGAKASASWFNWVAGLTLVNSLLAMSHSRVAFVIGLTVAQFADGYFGIAQHDNVTALIISAICAGVFFLLGKMATQGRKVAYLIGIVLIVLDTLFLAYIVARFHGNFSSIIIDLIFRFFVVSAFVRGWKSTTMKIIPAAQT